MAKITEHKLQCNIYEYCIMMCYPVVASQNGVSITIGQRWKLLKEGMCVGIPDLQLLLKNGRVVWFEVKLPEQKEPALTKVHKKPTFKRYPAGKESDRQIEVGQMLKDMGHDRYVIHSIEELQEYMKPYTEQGLVPKVPKEWYENNQN